MISTRTRGWIAIATLLGGGMPLTVVAQVTGKENVPGGVELRPPMPPAAQPSTAPAAPALARPPSPVMAPPAAGSGGASSAAPAADKASPPPKGSKKKSSKRNYELNQPDAAMSPRAAPAKPAPPGIGGGGDERRPGGVERAPGQPQ